eukprot:CAMPEP_0174708336 /NCGR_PEP_ID=MMETSP1094-20130205/10622_1 /TAXON_ID=156173 /ORGANISM="Chrysochromulina brevifilum, Strain UTEX LB 985" /LENGTH=69 /DNA_ID=CAMNT_0015906879 /DNA_START=137 /DNA_END=342 /DNA_ORIENTATION=+
MHKEPTYEAATDSGSATITSASSSTPDAAVAPVMMSLGLSVPGSTCQLSTAQEAALRAACCEEHGIAMP